MGKGGAGGGGGGEREEGGGVEGVAREGFCEKGELGGDVVAKLPSVLGLAVRRRRLLLEGWVGSWQWLFFFLWAFLNRTVSCAWFIW